MAKVRQVHGEREEPIAVRVAGEILRSIQQGELKPQDRLPSEQVLAERFKVSRPSLREALSALQFAGYLGSRQGYGTVVLASSGGRTTPPNAQDDAGVELVRVFEARLVVEPEAVRLAALAPDRALFRAARSMLDGMWLAVDGAGELGISSDISLHRAVLAMCPNPYIRSTAERLLDLTNPPNATAARSDTWADPHVIEGWAVEHEAVLGAIQTREPDRAAVCARRHLLSTVRTVAERAGTPERERTRLTALMGRYRERLSAVQYTGSTGQNHGQPGQRSRQRERQSRSAATPPAPKS